MPRCCVPHPREFEPCYASVLVAGVGDGLRSAVWAMEHDSPLCPCVTGWCGACKRVAALVSGRDLFPCPSAHLAHALVVHARVEATLAGFSGKAKATQQVEGPFAG